MVEVPPIRRRFLSVVASTNDVAREIVAGGDGKEGILVVAERPTRGRGRGGRGGCSAPALGLWATLILRPPLRGRERVGSPTAVACRPAGQVAGIRLGNCSH